MINKKNISLLAVIMLLVFMVSACGQNGDGGAQTADSADSNINENEEADLNDTTGSETADEAYLSGITASDYITLGEYKGIELTESEVSISEEYVQQYIDTYLLAPRAITTPIEDRTDVREGDTANIDYAGYRDGVAFDGGTAQGQDLVIGSGQFIPGFEEGLIGKNVGDTVSLDLTFPDDYINAEMAGVSVVFEVTINSISISELPELTDELVKELAIGDCETVEELNSYLYDYFYSSAVNQYNQTVKNDITEAVMANCEFKKEPPAKLTERYSSILVDDMTMIAESYGMDLNTYAMNYYNMSETDYMEIVKSNAENMARQYIMFQAISDEEGLNMTDEEKNKAMEEWVSNYGYDSVEAVKDYIDEKTLEEYVMAENVVSFLLENAIINTNES